MPHVADACFPRRYCAAVGPSNVVSARASRKDKPNAACVSVRLTATAVAAYVVAGAAKAHVQLAIIEARTAPQ